VAAFTDDVQCHDERNAFMFGNSVLAVVVVEENAHKTEVYLPQCARWLDTQSGVWYTGGQVR
jgi:alpha-glucosidase (family GH31 glycosyl hydrolase)